MKPMLMQSYEEGLSRSAVYQLLSLAFLYPGKGAPASLASKAGNLGSVATGLGAEGMAHALGQFSEQMSRLTDDALLDEYIAVFGHSVSSDCPQYECEYEQAHIFQKSHTLADLNTFYNAFGVTANPELKERPDHISIEMEFMYLLALKEVYAQLNDHGEDKVLLCREAQKSFLEQHLVPWIKSFIRQVSLKAGNDGIYGSLARLLDIHMSAEFQAFGLNPAPLHQTILPLMQEADPDCEACPESISTPQEG